MCGPAAIGIAGLVIAAAGTAISVKQQRDQAEFEAELIEQQQEDEKIAHALRKEDRQRRLRRTIAEQRVLFGASGTDIDAEILAETGAEFAREQFADDFRLNRTIWNQDASITNIESSRDNAITQGVIDFGISSVSTLNSSGALKATSQQTEAVTGGAGLTGVGLERRDRLPGRV